MITAFKDKLPPLNSVVKLYLSENDPSALRYAIRNKNSSIICHNLSFDHIPDVFYDHYWWNGIKYLNINIEI